MKNLFKQPLVGFVAGVIVGSVIITVINVSGVEIQKTEQSASPVITTKTAAESLLKDWEKSLRGTWAMDAVVTRHLSDGRTTSETVHYAQRPPDQSQVGLREATGTINGRSYVCALTPNNTPTSCNDIGPATDFDEMVQSDVAAVKQSVLGESRQYDVEQFSDGCYRLYLKPSISPANRTAASLIEYCFDSKTGAPIKSHVVRAESTDDKVVTATRNPTDEDFAFLTTAKK